MFKPRKRYNRWNNSFVRGDYANGGKGPNWVYASDVSISGSIPEVALKLVQKAKKSQSGSCQ